MNENGKRIELICGENDYLKKQYINSLVSKETSTNQENFSEVIYIDGKSASIEELQNALMTIPFFAEYNLVVIYNLIEKYKNNTDTKKKSAKKGSNNWNTILEFFNSLPIQKQILLVEHWQTPKDITGNPSDEKKDLKVEVDHLIEKLGLKNLTITKQFKNLLPIELETWITKELLNNGKKISNRNARLIAEYVGNDMWTLSNEIEKILNYCQDEIIEEEHLEILINNTKELQIFKLVDLLLDHNIAVSFKNIPSIFESGLSEYDENIAYINLNTLEDFFDKNIDDRFTEYYFKDPKNIEYHKENLMKLYPDAFVYTWADMNSSLFSALKVERNVMFIILSLIIIVAAFNIISGLTILVKNKTRDIAILKSIGVLNKSIIKIFFLVGVSIGTSATIFGIFLGVTFSIYVENIRQFLSSTFNISLFPEEIYFLSKMPSEININSIVIITICSILITIVVSIFPALKAANMDPIKSLKYE